VADIQNVLGSDESFVAWTLADEESYLFVIRRDRARFFKLDLTNAQTVETIKSIRKELTAAGPFDVSSANELYTKLLGPADFLVRDTKNLIVVPTGPLQSLPLSVLVTTSAPQVTKNSDYKLVPWLIRRQALTVLPAASSLVALRRFASGRRINFAFAGFGDPDFKGKGDKRGLNAAGLFRGAEVLADGIRELPQLPETADELRAEARALGAPETSIHLGADASVATVEKLDLSNTGIISFATHGLIAGDLPKLVEPALVLTPPTTPTLKDDGLLRASQVSQLKLDADFVILSACNTAASDGTPGAEGLSGLAKAFFYAGAHSLLVSHWAVDSDATVKLTTGLFKAISDDRSIGRAEALRRSILSMIDNAKVGSDDAHPSSWAPFILAGEGGVER
jgi:CHAT domain-containing protein